MLEQSKAKGKLTLSNTRAAHDTQRFSTLAWRSGAAENAGAAQMSASRVIRRHFA